jgi:hypothetical protein
MRFRYNNSYSNAGLQRSIAAAGRVLVKEGFVLHIYRPFLFTIALLSAFSVMADEGVTFRQTAGTAILENAIVRVEFDLAAGTYRASDKHDGSSGFRAGCIQVEGWASNQKGTTCLASERPIADSLGSGRTMTIECNRPGQPTLLLEITLYNGKSFLILRAGTVNTTKESLRVKNLYPLTAARAFSEVGEIGHAKTLNGEGGGRDTTVQSGPARSSSNNVLMTFRKGDRRRSVVLGGLTYHEWMKWAAVWPSAEAPSDNAVRLRELSSRIAHAGGKLDAYLDCGADSKTPDASPVRLLALRGKPFDFASVFAAPCYNTVLFDDKQVEISAEGLDPKKHYVLGFSWWDYSSDGRIESVSLVSGDGTTKTTLVEKDALPAYALVREQLPVEKAFDVPSDLYASGKMKILFTFDGAQKPGSNAVVSEVWLIEGLPGVAKTIAAPPPAATLPKKTEKAVYLHIKAMDPVGRRVDPGERYLPEDCYYVDFATDDPFKAAEQYGLAVRSAQQATPNPYTFPTICSWYAGVTFEPAAQNHPEKSRYGIATTKGHVDEIDFIRTKGFLDYSTIALRLVPDNYTPNNPQGWWDDKHWQEQGFYTPPYETTKKWGQAVQRRGGLAFTYFQSDRVSADFRKQHADLVLPGRGALDYTKPEVQRYMQGVYAAMRGNIAGMMFDYCDELWCFNLVQGGFHDDRVTAASVYRRVFQLAKEGLGRRSWIHERPVFNPGSDMAVGLIDSQRTSGDTASISPKLIARSGLRWYKNRVLFAYDMDSKSLLNAWKETSPNITDEDGRRMALTMCYVAASRLLLANSFRDLPPDVISDLERTAPYHSQPQSARPLDAFIADDLPRVYDFPINADWHQLTLLNADGDLQATLKVALSGEPAAGAIGLDPKSEYYFYDFWNDTFSGRLSGSETLKQTLRAGEARMLSVHRVELHPQFLSTNRHVMQGFVDLVGLPQWDAERNALSGVAKVVGRQTYQIILASNGHLVASAKASGATAKIEPLAGSKGLYRLSLEALKTTEVVWTVTFSRP